MRHIHLQATVAGIAPATAFAELTDFARFPGLSTEISAIDVQPGGAAGRQESEWSVEFRHGLLTWTEWERIDHVDLRVDFGQIEGDFADFHGSWQVGPHDCATSTEIVFEVTYDFGIESLADAMDSIAERLLLRVVADILDGLFDGAELSRGSDREALPVSTDASADPR